MLSFLCKAFNGPPPAKAWQVQRQGKTKASNKNFLSITVDTKLCNQHIYLTLPADSLSPSVSISTLWTSSPNPVALVSGWNDYFKTQNQWGLHLLPPRPPEVSSDRQKLSRPRTGPDIRHKDPFNSGGTEMLPPTKFVCWTHTLRKSWEDKV